MKAFSTLKILIQMTATLLILSGCSGRLDKKPETAPVIFASSKIISYDTTSAQVMIRGLFQVSGVTDLTVISFHLANDCKDPEIGHGARSDFEGSQGISVHVSSTDTSKIYVSTNNLLPGCFFLLEYKLPHDPPGVPNISQAVPPSPSRVSYTPTVSGTITGFATSIKFYSDAVCSHLVGTGTTSDFTGNGIALTLSPNVTNHIYAISTEAFGNSTPCTSVGTYIHSTTGPAPPTFTRTAPASPSNASTTPTIFGTTDSSSLTVNLFSDPGCSTSIGSGTSADFQGTAGVTLTAMANSSTTVYAVALDSTGIPSLCTYLTTYVHDTVAPAAPSYISASPASPTRVTTYPQIKGIASPDTAVVKFFNSAGCTTGTQIGSGSKAEFESTGSHAGVTPNSTTSIYAQDFDAAGNASACTKMTDYLHNTIPPTVPIFGTTIPISPNNQSITPLVQGNLPPEAVQIDFFDDSNCTHHLATGTAAAFMGAGVTVPVTANATTTLYANATDIEGNVSVCAALTNYAHSTQPSLPPAYVQSSPASPSRVSNRPAIIGSADRTISKVQLFSDAACSSSISGNISRSIFVTSGVQVTLPTNAITQIYGMATDVYGNFSPCTYLTTFTHDNVAPLNPVFVSTTPTSPNNVSYYPQIFGQTFQNPASVLPINRVTFFDSNFCVNQIGQGLPSEFSGASGITLNANPDSVTYIYAKTSDAAGNQSACSLMLNYTHDSIKPGNPIFSSTLPASPSYTQTTLVRGSISSSLDFLPITSVNLYSDSSCTTLMTSGTQAQFTSTGITVVSAENATTSIYAQTVDLVGNQSLCKKMLDFVHNDIGPIGLNLTQNPDGSVIINWTPDATASPTPKYIVKRSLASGGPYQVLTWANNGSNYTDVNINNGKTYYYTVAATNNTGISYDSAEASILVGVSAATGAASLTATPGPAQVTLNWSGFSDDMFYKVYRSTQPGGPYTLLISGLQNTTYIDKSVVDSTLYYYLVTGLNPAGESLSSNEASVMPIGIPTGPTHLQIAQVASSPACGGAPGLLLTWSPSPYYNSFTVQRGQNSNGEGPYASNIAGTSWTDCNPYVAPGGNNANSNTGYYTVVANWGPLQSDPSNEVNFANMPTTTVTALPGNSSVGLVWTAQLQASSYNVYRSTSPGGPYTLLASGLVTTTYTDNSVSNGNSYFYVVRTFYPSTAYGWDSAEVSGIPTSNSAAPSNLVLFIASGKPNLTWTAPNHYNYFNIYRASAPGGPYVLQLASPVNTYTDSSPLTGMNYYRVTTVWGSFESSPTSSVSFRNGVTATLTATGTSTAINLTWASVTGANNYRVYRSSISGGPYTLLGATSGLSYSDTGVVADTGYFYVITAGFADGTWGLYSAEKSAMRSTSVIPGGLTVLATTSASVTLTWANFAGSTKYKIYRATAAAGPYGNAVTAISNTGVVSSLAPGTTYYFKVSQVTGSVESSKSNYVMAATYAPPASPTVAPGNGIVDVSWSPVSGATSYNLSRSTDGTNFSVIASGIAGVSYTDNSVTNGTLYFYILTAVFPGTSLDSPMSNSVTPGVTPPAPAKPSITSNTTGTSITMGWAAVSGATSYNVYQSTTSGGPWGTPVLSTSSTTGNLVPSLTPGQVYYFSITALNGTLESALSSQIVVIPSVTPPAPTVAALSPTSIQVTWSAVTGASTYDILVSSDDVNYTVLTTGVVSTNYTDTTAVSGAHYSYEYLPRGPSNEPMAISPPSVDVVPGSAAQTPVGVLATTSNLTNVTVSWVPTPLAMSYNVYRATASGGPYSLVSNVLAPLAQLTDNSVISGNTYFYVVTSINASSVESGYSNEASIQLLTAPTGVTASNSGNSISVAWSATGGAVSYTVKRGQSSGGPYGVVSSGSSATTFLDSNLQNGTVYYYVVEAVYASGVHSFDSSEASATAAVTMNLQVPIELTDSGLSSDITDVTFERTRTSLDPNNYDGTVTYNLEVVALNGDASSHALDLVDSSGTTITTLNVTANTSAATRLSKTFTPNPGADNYRLSVRATTNPGDVQVLSARLWVNQVGASKTKIYVPLLASTQAPSSADLNAPIATTNSGTFALLPSALDYLRDTSQLDHLADFNAWELEALVSTSAQGVSGSVALVDTNSVTTVAASESLFTSQNVGLVRSPFNEGSVQFDSTTEGHQFELSLRCQWNCTLGTVSVYKAGLWISIDHLTKVEVPVRVGIGAPNLFTATVIDNERTTLDLSQFSNPSVYLQAVATPAPGATGTVELNADSTFDSGSTALSVITGSALSFPSIGKSYLRSATPISLTNGQRNLLMVTPSSGAFDLIGASVLIRAHP